MAISGVGLHASERRTSSHDGAGVTHPDRASGPDTSRECKGSHVASLSRHHAAGGDLHGALGLLHAGDKSTRSSCTEDVSGVDKHGTMRGNEAYGGKSGAGAHQSESAGGTNQQAASVIAGLQLVNQGNYCYQHAFILSYMWASHFAAGCSLPLPEVSSGFHGRLQPVIDFLTSGARRVILSRCLMWASLLQQWRQPQRQHDVGEFMSHVMQKARPDSMWGAWHMMTAAGEVRDVGDFHGPLMVHICNPSRVQSTTLQALVDGWTDAGEGVRRLIYEAPPLLCVQISRFHGRRKIRKLMHQVMLGNGRVHIPCRERPGVDASELCYRVTAISVHLGNTPSSGHYRAVLMAQGSSECALGTGDFEHNPAYYNGALYTDDGCAAVPVLQGDVHAISCNMYLMWCIRVE